MKLRKHIYVITTFLVILLSSCSVPRAFTTIDVLRPARVTFRPEVKNVVIVINAPIQPENIGHIVFENEHERNEILKFDSAAIFCTASLRENLESKGFFKIINSDTRNFNQSNRFYKVDTLNKYTIRKLCKKYNSDAVISLDHISTIDQIAIWNNIDDTFATIDVEMKTIWSIHYPAEKIKSDNIQFIDNFSWDININQKQPIRYNALVDAAILTGQSVADRFIPYWEKQDRYFYTPKRDIMTQAMDSVSYRKWESAIKLWEKALYSNKEKISVQFQAANNIAIAYEILQDYPNAIKYAKKAVNLYPNIITFDSIISNSIYDLVPYIEYLERRQEEIKLLNKQLSEN